MIKKLFNINRLLMSYLLWYDEDDENYKYTLEQLLKVSNPKEVINKAGTAVF